MQELLQTFTADATLQPQIAEISLKPSFEAGTFVVTVQKDSASQPEIVWERRKDGGFPDAKELKQRVRNIIWPDLNLGHVDGKKTCIDCNQSSSQS